MTPLGVAPGHHDVVGAQRARRPRDVEHGTSLGLADQQVILKTHAFGME